MQNSFYSVVCIVTLLLTSNWNLTAQNPCNEILKKIRSAYPWMGVTLEQEEQDCTTQLQYSLDSLYTALLNTPDLTKEQREYVRKEVIRINKMYGTGFNLTEEDWRKVKFYKDGNTKAFIRYLEDYAINFQKQQHILDSIAEYRRKLYDEVIWPQLKAAKTDDARRAIAAKYPDLVRFIENCGNNNRIE